MATGILKFLKMHVKIFKLVGYCDVSLNENCKRNLLSERWLVLWSCLLLIGFNVLLLLAVLLGEDFFFPHDAFGYFNDVLKVVCAYVAVTVSYLETIFKRSEVAKFWKRFYILQRNSRGEDNSGTSDKLCKTFNFLAIFYVVLFSELSTTLLFIVLQPMTKHLITFNAVFMPFVYAVHMRNMQFIFYIEILRSELWKLQQDLNLMVDQSSTCSAFCGSGVDSLEEFLRKKLLEKQKNYHRIYEMHEQFLCGFGFSISAVLLMVYVCVLVDVYFAYYTFYQDLNKTGTYEHILAAFEGKLLRLDSIIYRNTFVATSLFANSNIFNNLKKLYGSGEF